MAKRFIDTGLFDDEWFMELSKDGKILWLYFITKCDHAGLIHINAKLTALQTGIKDINNPLVELGNRIVRVKEQLYFIPKYISFQYPGFPKSNVKQQASAIELLKKYDLLDNSTLTVRQELTNSYVNVNGNGNDNGGSEEEKKPIKTQIPEIEEFKKYALENDPSIDIMALENKYKAWKENGWKNGNNKEIKNWKSTLLNTMPYMKHGESTKTGTPIPPNMGSAPGYKRNPDWVD